MLLPKRRRLRRLSRLLLGLVIILLTLDTLTTTLSVSSTPAHRILPTSAQSQGNYTVYVVSVHRNTEEIQRAAWNAAVENLARYLGPQRMFFSAFESGSQDGTKDQLRDLRARLDLLGVEHRIKLGLTVWEQLNELDARPPPDRREEGWIWNSMTGTWDMRRIPYLSRVRNHAMGPLWEMEREGRKFDKVLWLNDVVFDNEDIVTLLNTRDGEYAAACSMDYKIPPHYYDTFALRDDRGNQAFSSIWPWFISSTSRTAARRLDPVPVKSCWNGMVAFDSRPFYSLAMDFSSRREENHHHQDGLEHLVRMRRRKRDKRAAATTARLQFRAIPDSLADMHLEGSECCLIHADNPLSDRLGVWLNPAVRVGYSVPAYEVVRASKPRTGSSSSSSLSRYPSARDAILGSWSNRWWRWFGTIKLDVEKVTIRSRLSQWVAEGKRLGVDESRVETGDFCLINEMQIMWSNGWKHL